MMNRAQPGRILVFSDFDGTIIDIETYVISRELVEFLRRDNKLDLVLVTSRAWDGIAPYTNALNLSCAQITENGAVIIDPVNGEIVYKRSVPLDAEEAIKKLARRRKLVISLAGDGKQVGRISLVAPFWQTGAVVRELKQIPKITFVADHQAGSLDKSLIDITPEKVDKMSGVREWLKLYPRRYEKIYAVGNSLSDLPLFKSPDFLRVAVEDGAPELKRLADSIIPGPSQQGFLRFLDSLSPSSLSRSRL